MKKMIIMAGILFHGIFSQAQSGSWKILLNNKTILSTGKEDEKENCKKIKASTWNKSGNLTIEYTEDEPGVWFRSFLFYDKDDNELLRKDSTTRFTISFAALKKLYRDKKEIIIYTTIAPVDPNMAIRIRRVHLCTLRLP
jgi:hypothetical protein